MQKKIIALAVASALAIPALAMAEATVYGKLRMAYEVIDNGDKTNPAPVGNADPSKSSVSNNRSYLGFKGSEDLGNGMKALWQMEGQVTVDVGTSTLFSRNTFAGLSSEYGTVLWGNHDTPYRMATRKFDLFNDTIADNRTILGGVDRHNGRQKDVAVYLSPDFSGFNFAAAYVGKTDNGFAAPAPSTLTSLTSLSGSYARDNYTVTVATQTIAQADKAILANDGDKTATKVAGSYSMDALTVALLYEMTSNDVGGAKTEGDTVFLSVNYNVSDNGSVKFGYTSAGEGKTATGATNTGAGATQASLGYFHMLSESTSVFALYTAVDNDVAANYGLGNSGSSAGFATTVSNGDDPSAVAVGMRIAF